MVGAGVIGLTTALELRDDYGKLIDPGKGAFGRIRQGGDAGRPAALVDDSSAQAAFRELAGRVDELAVEPA